MKDLKDLKILVLGHTFNNGSAGITMRTLFSNFTKNQLFCASYNNIDTAHFFKSYYCMGNKEMIVRFPFSILYKEKTQSRVINRDENQLIPLTKPVHIISKKRHYYETIISPLLKALKIYPFRLKYHLSTELSQWIAQENPDIIYAVLGSLEECRILNSVARAYPQSKIVVHFLDDWITVAASQTLIPPIYKHQINRELKNIFDNASLCLAISDYMSIEYEKRYHRKFISFHNPVDIEIFDSVKRVPNKTGEIKLTYIGRVDKDNYDVINDIIEVINLLNKEGYNFKLNIYTNANSKASYIDSHITKGSNVNILPYVAHNKIADILINKSDILLLPSSFKKRSIKYVKLSISTKLTEYLATKKPVIIYAPTEIAISQFCIDNNCATVISKRDVELLKNTLLQFSSFKNTSEEIDNGYNLVKSKYSKKYICHKFENTMLSTIYQ